MTLFYFDQLLCSVSSICTNLNRKLNQTLHQFHSSCRFFSPFSSQFELTLTKRNTNVKAGFVSCYVISFSPGSVLADVVTEFDTRENVTAQQVNDVIETEAINQPGGNVTLPLLPYNFTLDRPISSDGLFHFLSIFLFFSLFFFVCRWFPSSFLSLSLLALLLNAHKRKI